MMVRGATNPPQRRGSSRSFVARSRNSRANRFGLLRSRSCSSCRRKLSNEQARLPRKGMGIGAGSGMLVEVPSAYCEPRWE